MKQEPFVIERTYAAPIDKVWQAITDKDQMKEWYFDLERFYPVVGFEFSFSAGEEGGTLYIHHCKVVEVIPGKKLAYSWRYEDYPGDSVVTWELFSEGSGTRVKLTHTGLETFTGDQKGFARESFAAGWTDILGASLKKFVDKTE